MPETGAPSGGGTLRPALTAFRHGVASADPLPDGVLLWTRCTAAGEPVTVEWWLSPTQQPSEAVAGGTVEARPEHD
ncbi:MAG: PhoD-like phosphatase N-terminal domain-containing protein, partial [Actinomycetota bacterium]|nr:PhoD-like phosphatase N-terminal domain-containing protein [Actinomycetota bacterium]